MAPHYSQVYLPSETAGRNPLNLVPDLGDSPSLLPSSCLEEIDECAGGEAHRASLSSSESTQTSYGGGPNWRPGRPSAPKVGDQALPFSSPSLAESLSSSESTQTSYGVGPNWRPGRPSAPKVADQVLPFSLPILAETTQESLQSFEQLFRGVVQEELRCVKEVLSGEIGVARDQLLTNIEFLRTSLDNRDPFLEETLRKTAGAEEMIQTTISQTQNIPRVAENATSNNDVEGTRAASGTLRWNSSCNSYDSEGPSFAARGLTPTIMPVKTTTLKASHGLVQKWSRTFLQSLTYEIGIGIIICCSSISLGLQTEFKVQDPSPSADVITSLQVVEHVCLVIFALEVGLTVLVEGWKCFQSLFFIFDSSLVFLGVLHQWILNPLFHNNAGMLKVLCVLRSFRLYRIFRLFRELAFMKSTWQLLSGLMASAPAVFSTLTVLFVIIYTFACLGVECITTSDFLRSREDTAFVIENHFDSLYATMITLVQFVTLDDVNSVYAPLIKANPWMIFYFLPILAVVSISVMNVITSVIVETAMSLSEKDKTKQRRAQRDRIKNEVPMLEGFFVQLHKEDECIFSRKEFVQLVFEELPEVFQRLIQNFHFDSMGEVFDILDHDASGKLTKSEFVTAVLNLLVAETSNVPNEILLVLKHLRMSEKKTADMAKAIFDIRWMLGRMRYSAVTESIDYMPSKESTAHSL